MNTATKFFRTVLAIVLVFAFLLSVIACSGANSSVTTSKKSEETMSAVTTATESAVTTIAATTEKSWENPVPESNFGETQINFVTAGVEAFSARSIMIDGEPTDTIESAIYERNKFVEQRLNVKINLVMNTGYKSLETEISPVLQAGGDDYDIIGGYQYFDLDMATKGWLLNLNDLKEYDADYINIENPWWATDYIKEITYKDQLYWVTGDLALYYTGGMFCTFVNARLYDTTCKASYGDIYDYVRAGKWTYDNMMAMAELGFKDAGDDKLTFDSDDIIGFSWENGASSDGMAVGAGVNWTTKNSDGTYTLIFNDKNEKLVKYMEYLYEIEQSNVMKTRSEYVNAGDDSNLLRYFASGNILFGISRVQRAETELREMEDDFYIIPLPKLDETQENYRTAIMDSCSIYGISHSSSKVKESAATLEAMAAESYHMVTPEYFDIALKYKYSRDPRSAEMIDFLRDTVYTDFGFAWASPIMGTPIRENINSSPASTFKKNFTTWNKKLTELMAALDKVESDQRQ